MSFLSGFNLMPLPALNALSDVQIESPLASPRNTSSGTFQTSTGTYTPQQLSSMLNGMGMSTTYGQTTPTQQTDSSTNSNAQPVTALGDISGGALGPQTSNTSTLAGTLTNTLLSSRIVSALIGLIFIAGGLFMFKGTREYVVTGAKTAAKLAA